MKKMNDFLEVTFVESNRKVAIRKSDVQGFQEDIITIKGVEKPCVKIDLPNDRWIKVKETFNYVKHWLNQK